MEPRALLAGLVMDSNDPQTLAGFWSQLLGYTIVENSPGWVEMMDPSGRQPHLTCQGINRHVQHGGTTSAGNRFHLDLGLRAGKTDRVVLAAMSARLEELWGHAVSSGSADRAMLDTGSGPTPRATSSAPRDSRVRLTGDPCPEKRASDGE